MLIDIAPIFDSEHLQGISYQGALSMFLCVRADDGPEIRMRRQMGLIPIMLKSKACYLRNLSRCLHAATEHLCQACSSSVGALQLMLPQLDIVVCATL